MIDPNKLYKSKIGIITKIETQYREIDKFRVTISDIDYYGYITDIRNIDRFSVGDRVTCQMRFSIVSDTFLIVKMRKARKT